MVLMRIALPMSKNQVRANAAFELFEAIFDCTTVIGQETVTEFLERHFLFAAGGKQLGPFLSFTFTGTGTREHHPANLQIRAALFQLQEGPATANFNIVG